MLLVRPRPLAGGVLLAALAALGLAVVALLQSARAPGWDALGWAFASFGLACLGALLAPASALLAARGWGALPRRSLAALGSACALCAVVGVAVAVAAPSRAYPLRAVAAFAAAWNGWGALLVVRLWRAHSNSFAATRPST